jgi:hypothetical protein
MTYSSTNKGNRIQVKPADPQLIAVWKGQGEIQTATYGGNDSFRRGALNFEKAYENATAPTFVVEFQNRSGQAIEIKNLSIDVEESNADLQPAIQLLMNRECGSYTEYDVKFDLENVGWSAARDAQFKFSFQKAPGSTEDAIPAEMNVGTIASRANVNFESALSAVGVDVRRLRQKFDAGGFSCTSEDRQLCLKSLRSNPVFGRLGPSLRVAEVNYGSRIEVRAAGALQYVWIDNKGRNNVRSSPFSIDLGLGKFPRMAECGEGGAPTPARVTPKRLRLDQSNYKIPVSFARSIGPGQTSRFSLPVDAEKSSRHNFRITATLGDGRTVSSQPIDLLYYRSSRPLEGEH